MQHYSQQQQQNLNDMKKSNKIKKEILQKQIFRLAKIYTSKPVSVENMDFHLRVGRLQAEAIKAKKNLK